MDINAAQIFIAFVVLLFSLTVHETAHAWTADRLGDPTARLLGRVSLNPMVHADLIGTIVFPLLAMVSGVPLIGWAKPVPVNPRQLANPRRDYVLVAAAGPASNLLMAVGSAIVLRLLPVSPVTLGEPNVTAPIATLFSQALRLNVLLAVFNMIPVPPLDGGNVLSGLLPARAAFRFNALLRPYGFLILYALMLTRGFEYLVIPPSRFLLSWLQ
ncbi:MAG TPA: site-2 protease family protein [Vicinamibacterales bacterium]|nr:site-2 protease family protein [Vicinamibacterales bacterium]